MRGWIGGMRGGIEWLEPMAMGMGWVGGVGRGGVVGWAVGITAGK